MQNVCYELFRAVSISYALLFLFYQIYKVFSNGEMVKKTMKTGYIGVGGSEMNKNQVCRIIFIKAVKFLLMFFIRDEDRLFRKQKIDAASRELYSYLTRILLRKRREPDQVEKDYNKRINQGTLIDTFCNREQFYLLQGVPVMSSWLKMRPHFQKQFAEFLSGLNIRSILEVGGGELTKLEVMRDIFGDVMLRV